VKTNCPVIFWFVISSSGLPGSLFQSSLSHTCTHTHTHTPPLSSSFSSSPCLRAQKPRLLQWEPWKGLGRSKWRLRSAMAPFTTPFSAATHLSRSWRRSTGRPSRRSFRSLARTRTSSWWLEMPTLTPSLRWVWQVGVVLSELALFISVQNIVVSNTILIKCIVISCSTKGRASLVIGKQRQRERLLKRRWAEEEAGKGWGGQGQKWQGGQSFSQMV